MEFALKAPERVEALPYTAFYWPPWTPWGIAQLYRSQRCLARDAYAVHLWETKMWGQLLSRLEPPMLRAPSTCFAHLAAAVFNGSYDFSLATLHEGGQGGLSDEDTRVLMSSPLGDFLDAAPADQTHAVVPPIPPGLKSFVARA
jgi:hypothetical protein